VTAPALAVGLPAGSEAVLVARAYRLKALERAAGAYSSRPQCPFQDPANRLAYLPLMYYRSMLNGKGMLDVLMNERYPRFGRPPFVSTS
jgi:hypothetical protein